MPRRAVKNTTAESGIHPGFLSVTEMSSMPPKQPTIVIPVDELAEVAVEVMQLFSNIVNGRMPPPVARVSRFITE